MEILLNGETAFLVKTSSGSAICDPANEEESRYVASSAADDIDVVAVLYSQPQKSSFQSSSDTDSAATISRAGEYEVGDLGIRGIALGDVDGSGSKRTSTSYRIDSEGIAVYVLGLPTSALDTNTVRMIGHVDVILLDASRLTMAPKELASMISSLEPSLVVANGLNPESGEPDPALSALLGELGGGDQQSEPQVRVSITRSSLPEDRRVIVLKPRQTGT